MVRKTLCYLILVVGFICGTIQTKAQSEYQETPLIRAQDVQTQPFEALDQKVEKQPFISDSSFPLLPDAWQIVTEDLKVELPSPKELPVGFDVFIQRKTPVLDSEARLLKIAEALIPVSGERARKEMSFGQVRKHFDEMQNLNASSDWNISFQYSADIREASGVFGGQLSQTVLVAHIKFDWEKRARASSFGVESYSWEKIVIFNLKGQIMAAFFSKEVLQLVF